MGEAHRRHQGRSREHLALLRPLLNDPSLDVRKSVDIVREAGLTRGALYHHFRSKKGLFLAVLEAAQQSIASRVEEEAGGSEDPWTQLLLGCRAFMKEAVEPRNRRILLVDGPAVLGWEAGTNGAGSTSETPCGCSTSSST